MLAAAVLALGILAPVALADSQNARNCGDAFTNWSWAGEGFASTGSADGIKGTFPAPSAAFLKTCHNDPPVDLNGASEVWIALSGQAPNEIVQVGYYRNHNNGYFGSLSDGNIHIFYAIGSNYAGITPDPVDLGVASNTSHAFRISRALISSKYYVNIYVDNVLRVQVFQGNAFGWIGNVYTMANVACETHDRSSNCGGDASTWLNVSSIYEQRTVGGSWLSPGSYGWEAPCDPLASGDTQTFFNCAVGAPPSIVSFSTDNP